MSRICGNRALAWALLAELTTPGPPAEWAAALEVRIARIGPATTWLDDEWRPDGQLLLEGLARRARRRGVDDLAELVEDATVAAQPGLGRLHRAVAEISEGCATELAAWDRGEADQAKALRVEQMALLVPDSPVRQEATRLASARLPVWSPVASLVQAYLLLETGR